MPSACRLARLRIRSLRPRGASGLAETPPHPHRARRHGLRRGFGEKRTQALDLVLRSLDHRFEVDDELPIDRVVCGTKRVERSRARSVENPEHRELLWRGGFGFDGTPRAPKGPRPNPTI